MEFKESNIDWVSEIPIDWTVRKLKYILNERIEKNNPIKTHEVLSLTAVQGVVPYSEKKASGGNKQKDDLSNYKIAYPNDIVVNSMNIVTGSVGLSNYYGCVSPVYYMFYTNDDKININYYNYIFKSRIFQRRLIGFGNGILQMTSEAGNLYAVRMKIPIDKFKSLLLPVPPRNVQNDIVNYLDNKIIFIEKIIEKYTKLTELLEEKRVTLINKVVTKGLNPNVALKDSGVKWIGDIPEHWECRKINTLSSVSRGASPRPIDDPIYFDENGEYSWVRISDVTSSKKYLNKTTERLSTLGKSLSVPIEPGRIFVSIAATVGKPIIANIKCCIHDGFVYFKNLNLNDEYLFYIFEGEEAYKGLGKLGTQLNLNTETIGRIYIPVPSEKEQKDIVNYLDDEISKIENTISKINDNINLLEEYKTSLIHHVVTGKIDVRSDEI